MRKLDISNYFIQTDNGDSMEYSVKESIVNMVFNPELKLDSVSLLRNDKLARKILDTKDDSILLEEAEYDIIKHSCNIIKGYTYNDVELVKRILEAPEVVVREE